jgi:hypothetical protein
MIPYHFSVHITNPPTNIWSLCAWPSRVENAAWEKESNHTSYIGTYSYVQHWSLRGDGTENLLCLNTTTWDKQYQIFYFVPSLAKHLNKQLILILFVFWLPLRLVNPECSVTCLVQCSDISGGFEVGSLHPPTPLPPLGVWLDCTDEIFKMCSR